MRNNHGMSCHDAGKLMRALLLTSLSIALFRGQVLADSGFFAQSDLVSDIPGLATVTDTNLHGAWGITRSATSPWWVNSTAAGLSLLFNGAGQPLPLTVMVPPTNSTPTGIVFNGGEGFQVASNKPARFIFVTLNGTISGWNPAQANTALAVLKVDNSGHAGYTGVTLAQRNGEDTLYAADFLQNSVDLFDTNFNSVTLGSGTFSDESVPSGYSVFNVQLVRDILYVTYAPTNALTPSGGGPGQGFVSGFDANGTLVTRLRHGPWMNAPWGVTLAPKDFGHFSNRLLVGMFGAGEIAAFDTHHGNFHGLLKSDNKHPIIMGKGLWGIGFGNGTNAGPTTTLYFAKDIVQMGVFHGLFGSLTASSEAEHEDNQGNEDEQ